ncbi:MAG: flagellar accessory protein FlaH [Thermoprotei archaeon]|nr:flagellar accessory protein FlaH [Thermoprotei archaeon]
MPEELDEVVETNIEESLEGYVLPTGNEELDMRLGGGIPVPNLLSIEGDHGTGKSLLAQQLAYGAAKAGKHVVYVTTESGVKELVMQTRKLSLDMTDEFLKGLIRIMPAHMEGVRWARKVARDLLHVLGNYMARVKDEYDVFIVDSFSVLAVYADASVVLDFLTRARTLVREGKLIILTIHPSVLPDEIMIRIRAISDSYIKLDFAEVGGRLIKVMKVVKLRGAAGPVDSTIAFDVDPAFGIKVVPLALAKA